MKNLIAAALAAVLLAGTGWAAYAHTAGADSGNCHMSKKKGGYHCKKP